MNSFICMSRENAARGNIWPRRRNEMNLCKAVMRGCLAYSPCRNIELCVGESTPPPPPRQPLTTLRDAPNIGY